MPIKEEKITSRDVAWSSHSNASCLPDHNEGYIDEIILMAKRLKTYKILPSEYATRLRAVKVELSEIADGVWRANKHLWK